MAKKGLPAGSKSGPPHPMLQALVARFLESNGFNSSHRIYNTERKKRPRKEGWQDTFARSYTEGFPPLESIFDEWKNQHWTQNVTSIRDDTSSASSAEDVQIHPTSVSTGDDNNVAKPSLRSASSSTSDSSEDDSDSSGSEGQSTTAPPKVTPTATTASTNSLKRKAPDSSSESAESSDSSDSSSDGESDAESDDLPVKKQRIESPVREDSDDSDSDADSDTSSDSESFQAAIKTKLSSDDDSSSSDDTNDSGDSSENSSDDEDEKVTAAAPIPENAASDSSGTVMGDHARSQSSSESSSSESATSATQVLSSKKKHIGAQPTRLAQLSANANANDFVSNTYVSYDYADKAFRDLSVTRGKGFTKEKNKKKRGSYRGGTIDIGGGKGFKFDD